MQALLFDGGHGTLGLGVLALLLRSSYPRRGVLAAQIRFALSINSHESLGAHEAAWSRGSNMTEWVPDLGICF